MDLVHPGIDDLYADSTPAYRSHFLKVRVRAYRLTADRLLKEDPRNG